MSDEIREREILTRHYLCRVLVDQLSVWRVLCAICRDASVTVRRRLSVRIKPLR